jgi:hypothetical protein
MWALPRQPVRFALFLTTALLVAVAHQHFVQTVAFNDGSLAGLLPWDDCAIVARALWPVAGLLANPTWHGVLDTMTRHAPRGPMGELQSFVAIMASRGDVYAAYALNWWAEAVALVSVVAVAYRLHAATAVAMSILVVTAPMATGSLVSLKGDYKAGLLIAVALLTLYEGASRRNRRWFLLGSSLLGLAMTAKLTAFFLPVWALSVLLVFECLRQGPTNHDQDLRLWRYWAATWRGCWLARRDLIRLGTLVAGPFLLLFGWALTDGLASYIALALASNWHDGMSVQTRLAFYGKNIGATVLTTYFIAGGCFAWFAARERRADHVATAVATIIVSAGILLPFVTAPTSGAEYASYISGALLGGALIFVRTIGGRNTRAALISLLLVGSTALALRPSTPRADADGLQEAKQRLSAVVDDIIALGRPYPRVQMMFEDGAAGFPNLAILHFMRTRQPLIANRIDYLEPVDRLRTELADTDVVLTLAPRDESTPPGYQLQASSTFPATLELARADELIASDGRFSFLRGYPWRGSELRMYVRTSIPGS